jgi:FKBP-type peptidyl-prolyl cis-trans isomerase (trigger factor)
VNLPGFRKGHIPEKVLVDRLGEIAILEEAAEIALKDITPEIIEKSAPTYIGRPKISITKLAPGNPLGFSILIAVMPEFKLPDYKKIAASVLAKPKEKVEVGEKEIADVIEEIRKQRAHTDYHKAHAEDKEHAHAKEDMEKHMPEITDETVKSFGDFKDVKDFKEKIKDNLTKEKEHKVVEKRRGELLESLVAATKIEIPDPLVEAELSKMFAQFENDIAGLGLKVEDYLKHIKKTPDDLRKDWMPDAEKRAKLNLILEEIAKDEKLSADAAAVEEEVKHLMSHYQDIDPVRAKLYVEHNLRIEKVIQFLESDK